MNNENFIHIIHKNKLELLLLKYNNKNMKKY